MATAFSFCLYILTFLVGLYLNQKADKNIYKRVFVIWLYIFLCFGYMTGSDWRHYELEFDSLNSFSHDSYIEFLFWKVFYLFKLIFIDFFLVIGILKCIYFSTILILLKKLSDNWLAAACILMPLSLNFMLIDNPLRFMCAGIFVNLSILQFFNCRIIAAILLAILSVFFHTTCVIVLLYLPLIKYNNFIWKLNRGIIVILFLLIAYIFSDIGPMSSIFSYVQQQMILVGAKDYSSYEINNNSALFTLGAFLRYVLFLFVVINKKNIKSKYGPQIYSLTLAYFFISQILLCVPTGFRLSIPLYLFAAAFYAEVIYGRKIWKLILIPYFTLLLGKDIYTGYSYIPYSNSIIYILTRHKSYNERYMYNYDAYEERFGTSYERD